MISHRLRIVLEQTEDSITESAKKLKVNDATIRDLMKNRVKNISGELACKIQRVYGVNAEWLVLGEGPMFIESPLSGYTPLPNPTAQLKGKDKETAHEFIDYLHHKTEFKSWLADKEPSLPPAPSSVQQAPSIAEKVDSVFLAQAQDNDVDSYPLLGRIAAGNTKDAYQNTNGFYKIDLSDVGGIHGPYFLLRITGDSMIDANLNHDDIVIVLSPNSSSYHIKSGDIVVALVNGESTIKRFAREKGQIILYPANQKYKPIPAKSHELLIQGKVLRKARI